MSPSMHVVHHHHETSHTDRLFQNKHNVFKCGQFLHLCWHEDWFCSILLHKYQNTEADAGMCAERADCKKLQSWRSGAQFCIKPLHDDNMVKPLTAQSLCCVWKIFTSSEGLSLKQHTMILPIALSPAAIKSCSLIKPLLVILLTPMKRLGFIHQQWRCSKAATGDACEVS